MKIIGMEWNEKNREEIRREEIRREEKRREENNTFEL